MFVKYQHIEKVNCVETDGLLDGECYIFPKIDGTNSSLWWDNGIKAGSRNRELTLDNDNANFYNWAINQDKFKAFFAKYPHLRLFGEWLVPHTLKTYQDKAWKNFYVFDVMNDGIHLPYPVYQPKLEEFYIDYIPPIGKIDNPSVSKLIDLLDTNVFLIKDGEGTGEGIVIKNYSFVNKYGRTIWGKIVKNDFKASHQKCQVSKIKDRECIEANIANEFITSALVEKEYSKIAIDGWESRKIPQLLNTVYYCLVKEEIWDILKKFKNPTIDFKNLIRFTNARIKELKPELF